MVFGWFKSEQRDRRRKVRLDRKHLEARSRRFLKTYLDADEAQKPQFYRAVEEASKYCQPADSGVPSSELEDPPDRRSDFQRGDESSLRSDCEER